MRQLKISKQITNRESQSLDKYLQEIGRVSLISPDEEVLLAKKIKEGDQQALEKLTKANLRFVVSVAKQYQNQGLTLGDLINEGNLGLTVKAILLDPEVRKVDLGDTSFGMKKSPLEGFIQVLRSLDAFTQIPITNPGGAYPYDTAPGNFTNPDLFLDNFGYPASQIANQSRNMRFLYHHTITTGTSQLQMVPFQQETVFNWYLPDYSPGGPVSQAGLVAPELQLANEPDVIRNINYFETITRTTNGISKMLI